VRRPQTKVSQKHLTEFGLGTKSESKKYIGDLIVFFLHIFLIGNSD